MTKFTKHTQGHVITHTLIEGPITITISEAIDSNNVQWSLRYGQKRVSGYTNSVQGSKLEALNLAGTWLRSSLYAINQVK